MPSFVTTRLSDKQTKAQYEETVQADRPTFAVPEIHCDEPSNM